MKNDIKIVQDFYDKDPLYEWSRLSDRHPYEFRITTYMMDQYIKEKESILDIGAGPGRYALYYAGKNCDVTMVDLAPSHVSFAIDKAKEMGLNINAFVGDALTVNHMIQQQFDHVFLMGPLYHLLDEKDRVQAIQNALDLLKPGGYIYITFIMMIAGLIYYMQSDMNYIMDADESEYLNSLVNLKPFSGDAFTKAHFFQVDEIEELMKKFNVEKCHLFGQEGILAPQEEKFLKLDKNVQNRWYDVVFKLLEQKDLLGYSNHLMFIGKKIK